jgi:hypothetical protein
MEKLTYVRSSPQKSNATVTKIIKDKKNPLWRLCIIIIIINMDIHKYIRLQKHTVSTPIHMHVINNKQLCYSSFQYGLILTVKKVKQITESL